MAHTMRVLPYCTHIHTLMQAREPCWHGIADRDTRDVYFGVSFTFVHLCMRAVCTGKHSCSHAGLTLSAVCVCVCVRVCVCVTDQAPRPRPSGSGRPPQLTLCTRRHYSTHWAKQAAATHHSGCGSQEASCARQSPSSTRARQRHCQK